MKTYAPSYYKSFKCIADQCRHSCCIGWDVYIDQDTAELYKNSTDPFGQYISQSMCHTDDGFCFEMNEKRRCPFLDQKGLCSIITKKGEDFLCEICKEHPRFYNVFSHRYEVGLGLSCEEAARIILSQKKPAELVVVSEDETDELELSVQEEYILKKRKELLNILHSPAFPMEKKVELMLDSSQCCFPDLTPNEWAGVLEKLERLDDKWNDAISLLKALPTQQSLPEFDVQMENLLEYFIFRHVSSAWDEEELAAAVGFSVLGYKIINWLCIGEKLKKGVCSFEKLCDFARMYSAEIEYSEENTSFLLELFTNLQQNT